FVGFVIEGVEALPEAARLRGYARFLDGHTLQIDEHTRIHTQATVIATGSSPFIPPNLAGLGDRLLINDDIFELTDLPESVAVFGAGVIGIELGQALHNLGVRMHLFGVRHNVGGLSDPMLKDEAIRAFQAEFPFQPDARIERVERVEAGVRVSWLDAHDQEQSETFAYALATAGRRPNVARLGLESLGVELDRFGLPPFDRKTLQVGSLPVFLAGDANHVLPLLHEAADEGRIAGRNAAHYPRLEAGQRRAPLAIVFTHPQIALVGQRFAELQESHTAIGHVSFATQGRSRVMLENKGLMRIYADYTTGRFLGAEIFGPRAEHLAHLLAWAHQQQLTIEQMLTMPFYHPVIEEGLRTALQDTAHAIKLGPPPEPDCVMEDPLEILATCGPEDPALKI
ncbi:MAG TPA: dihydrolipoyl dehydrogenase, partial [Candidatus Obscuribacterales bacterium]